MRPLRRIELDYPGAGRHPVWTIGHPESVTLQRSFPTLQRSANAMFAAPAAIRAIKLLCALVDLRLASVERVAGWLEGLAAREASSGRAQEIEGLEGLPPLFALARGEKDGRPASAAVALTTAPAGGMGPITGIPLALGASLLVAGELSRPGVSAPEAAIEPKLLLDRLAEHCQPRPGDPADLTVTTRSWSDARLEDELRSIRQRFA